VVTARQRRQAVQWLCERFDVSQRHACRLLRQHRSTQRQKAKKTKDAYEEEERLTRRMLELVRQHPRYGYRRVWALLRREGWRVNRKRVYRLWRAQGLKVPRKQQKKRRLGSNANGCVRRPAEHKDHVWAWDFLHDRTSDGRSLKWLTLVDEYTRECLALEVGRGMTATAVCTVLARVVRERGTPRHIRSDNGPEFIAKAIRAWAAGVGLETLYIEPGSPWENGYAESFNSKVRDELLNAEEFGSELEARVLAKAWRRDYNQVRPHSSLGYRTPAEWGAMVPRPDSAALRRPEEPSVAVDPTLTATGP
jgi:transposase InsO family protein